MNKSLTVVAWKRGWDRQWYEGDSAKMGGCPGRDDYQAMAILDATVLSLSNFSLFLLKAACLQSSKLEHMWCSGKRC